MKLFLSIIIALLIGASGATNWWVLVRVISIVEARGTCWDGTIFGLWLLLILHVVAICATLFVFFEFHQQESKKLHN